MTNNTPSSVPDHTRPVPSDSARVDPVVAPTQPASGLPPVPPPGEIDWGSVPPPPDPDPIPPVPPPPGRRSRVTWGVVGVACAFSALAGGFAGYTLADRGDTLDPESASASAPNPGPETSAASIQVGDCFADFSQFESGPDVDDAETIDSVNTADCDEPHALEAYFVDDVYTNIEGGYDDTTVGEIASSRCRSEFEDFVDADWTTSDYHYWSLTPTALGWVTGDRELICLVGSYNRELTTGTLEGVGR